MNDVRLADVCWAGPFVRAENALRQAGDLLARGRRDEGLALLAQVREDLAIAARFAEQELAP